MSWTQGLLSKEAAAAVAGILLLYIVGVIIERLYFSPIAKFPGPKLAAATFWYEFYFDVVQQGRYVWQIQKLHQKYGMLNAALSRERAALMKVQQVRLSGLTPTNCILRMMNSTMSCIAARRNDRTSGNGQPRCLGTPCPCFLLHLMIFTG